MRRAKSRSELWRIPFALLLVGCASAPKSTPIEAKPAAPATTSHKVTVAATAPFTLVGEYKKGTTLAIEVRSGAWRSGPSGKEVDGEGEVGALCLGEGEHHCIGGDGLSPRMGLIVLMTPCPIADKDCFVFGRELVGKSLSFAVPRDGFVYLAPNDWLDGLADNSGALEVSVSP
jgi:hypothetical protein